MSWRLLFSGTQSVLWTVSVFAAVGLTLLLSFWLLRLERRLTSVAVGRSLLILRLLIAGTLLFTLLQPVLTADKTRDLDGRVVVAIDVSESMDTRDHHATAAEKLRWAQALGMLGNDQTAALLEQWVADLEADREPQWLGSGVAADTALRQRTAAGRQRQVEAVLDELGGLTRREFVRRLLLAQTNPLLPQLSQSLALDVRIFTNEQRPVTTRQLDSLLLVSADNPMLSNLNMLNSGTDLVQVLSSLTTDGGNSPPRALVLLTDGRQTAAGDADMEARRLGSMNIPVFSIPIGSQRQPRDLSLASIEAPDAVFLNDQAKIVATLGTAGFEGQELQVQLQQNDRLIEQQVVTPAADTTVVRFEITAKETGRFDYRIAVVVQPGELRDDNNSRDFSLRVVDNKARVLLADGDARWEFRYLRNLLERDPQVDLQSVLFRQPNLQLLDDSFIDRHLPPPDALREQLANTDLLIVGDVSDKDIDNSMWRVVEHAVNTEGLTLLVIPGRRELPHGLNSSALAGMLPVESWQQRMAERYAASHPDHEQSSFTLQPTSDAMQLPMFQPDPGRPPGAAAEFTQLPGHPWIYAATPRQSAVTWAFAVHHREPSLRDPVIVHQFYGFGQVIWMGIDSTWRWRRRIGDTVHHRFWGQLVRWAAVNKSAAGNDQVRLTLSDLTTEEGRPVSVSARFHQQTLQQLTNARVEIHLTPGNTDSGSLPVNAEGADRVIILQPSAEQPLRFSGLLPGLPAETWQVQLNVQGGSLQLKEPVATELLVRPQPSAELANVSCHRDLLRQISQLSGGTLLEPWETSELSRLLQFERPSTDELQETRLWDHWLTLLVFFGLLTGEWVTRKLNGLP